MKKTASEAHTSDMHAGEISPKSVVDGKSPFLGDRRFFDAFSRCFDRITPPLLLPDNLDDRRKVLLVRRKVFRGNNDINMTTCFCENLPTTKTFRRSKIMIFMKRQVNARSLSPNTSSLLAGAVRYSDFGSRQFLAGIAHGRKQHKKHHHLWAARSSSYCEISLRFWAHWMPIDA